MPRTQTLNYKHTQGKRKNKVYKVRQDAYVLKAKEKEIY